MRRALRWLLLRLCPDRTPESVREALAVEVVRALEAGVVLTLGDWSRLTEPERVAWLACRKRQRSEVAAERDRAALRAELERRNATVAAQLGTPEG